jgi:DNA-directed RNA polymerase I subunit RPA2
MHQADLGIFPSLRRFSDDDTPVEYFGEQLVAAGYNYHGNEPMYSGVTGEQFSADIYIGLVYYQRLRHMVNDKFQVRTTGPVDPLTRQPVKGRKRQGGIRFGEMERDALLAHGTSFLLQDRLMNCSDYTTAWVCRTCGSMISLGYDLDSVDMSGGEHCRVCRQEGADAKGSEDLRLQVPKNNLVMGGIGPGNDMDVIAVPCAYSVPCASRLVRRQCADCLLHASPDVFRYFAAEMACMGIKLSVGLD